MIELNSAERTHELANALEEAARLLRDRAMATLPKIIDSADPESVEGLTVAWGRSVLEPTRGHVRETSEGNPVISDVDGAVVGMALCGALLIDDLDPKIAAGEFDKCSLCLERLDEIRHATADPSTAYDTRDQL